MTNNVNKTCLRPPPGHLLNSSHSTFESPWGVAARSWGADCRQESDRSSIGSRSLPAARVWSCWRQLPQRPVRYAERASCGGLISCQSRYPGQPPKDPTAELMAEGETVTLLWSETVFSPANSMLHVILAKLSSVILNKNINFLYGKIVYFKLFASNLIFDKHIVCVCVCVYAWTCVQKGNCECDHTWIHLYVLVCVCAVFMVLMHNSYITILQPLIWFGSVYIGMLVYWHTHCELKVY